jgi:flagellar basal body-associated protein FliL
MAKPIKPKKLKQKNDASEGENPVSAKQKKEAGATSTKAKGITMLQTIILAVVMLFASVAGPAITMYFLGPMLLKPIIAQAMPTPTEGEEGAEGEEAKDGSGEKGEHGKTTDAMGLSLGLDDFTVNLHRPEGVKGNQFLRAKMNLSVLVPEEQNCLATGSHDEHAEAAGGGGGHGGGDAAAVDPMEACMETFNKSMAPYVPTLRDIINTALMKRSAQQIATLEGQEDLKDELAHEMNTVLKNHGYTVQRVNLQDFIIQR